MDLNSLFERMSDETFWEVLNAENKNLRLHNKEWQKQNSICKEALNNTKLQEVLEERKPVELSKDDTKALIKYNDANDERKKIECEKMFNAGIRYAYFYLKKIGLLKDNESDLSK